MAIKLADTARPNNYVDAEHLGTFPVAYADDVWFADGTRLSEKTFGDTGIQVEELPLASAAEEGKVYQYIGVSGTYQHGYFYECVEDSGNPGTYIWNNVNTQAGGGSLQKAITASVDVGGIKTGDAFAVGTNYDDMWQNLLDPIKYPTLIAPSATIAGGTTLLETGTSTSRTITVTFNRGSISPAYGTSGYRAGIATEYSLNGGTAQANNEFTISVDAEHTSFVATVAYAAGEQPKDSSGADYDSPLPAGSVLTPAVNYEFVDALWANIASISEIAKQALVSKTAKVKEFTFPAATVANPEVFDVPASWTVTAVEVFNTLSNTWETCASEFTITDVTHDNAAGTSVNYKRYTCNLGYAMDSRKVRFKWS